MKKTFTDIDSEALDALILRVQEAIEHDLALSTQDCQLLLDALMTLASLQERLADNDITLHKLRKLVGMVRSSEKMNTVLGKARTQRSNAPKRSKKKHPPVAPVKPEVKTHKLNELSKGDTCPECQQGTLYKYDPATLLRIRGQSPFIPEQHVMERLRCNACGAYFTAELPPEVQADGESGQKYGYSARTLMALDKFYAGAPYYRQQSVQGLLGIKLAASTIFDQTEWLANAIAPVHQVLQQYAAQARHYFLDDTGNRILDKKPQLRKKRNSETLQERSGVYSSGLIAMMPEGHTIVLYQTNIGHAGEFIDEILSRRKPGHSPPLLMSDALSSNRPSQKYEVHHCLCNSHGRRQFMDVEHHFPDEVAQILTGYGEIWSNNEHAESEELSEAARLSYHKIHSLPVMERIRCFGQELLASGQVEANSGLGKAIAYFNKHYSGLSAFCHQAGAQLDNNEAERMLKLVARNRKNAMFHKTQAGASIADVVMSMLATTAEAGVNVFDYFNALQQRQAEVKANPESFLPWNYRTTI